MTQSKTSQTERVAGCVVGAAGVAGLFFPVVPAWAAVIALTLGAFLAWPASSKEYFQNIRKVLPKMLGGK